MKGSRTELKAALMQQAEVLVDELLDWTEQTHEPTLTQLEDVVLRLRQRLGTGMAQAVLEAQEATRPAPGPSCPQCGREMHYKDLKRDTLTSRLGELGLRRGYYHCRRCRVGLFPPGSATASAGHALE
jgi:hypothetical protein